MTNSLPNQRKEIAEKLRETKEECNQRDYPWMVEDLMRALGFLSYEDADDQIFDRLADLIDPTCTAIVDETHGMDDELVCSSCGCTLGFIVDNQPPTLTKYCPSCGSRIVREVE